MKELQAIVSKLAGGGSGVLATLVSVQGSSYRRAGARLLVTAEGERIGSVSGGCLEEDLLARARRVAQTGNPEIALYDTTSENDLVWGVGLGCHGIVNVLVEAVPERPKWAIDLQEQLKAGREVRLGVAWSEGAKPWGTRLEQDFPKPLPVKGVFWQTVQPPTSLYVFGAGDDAQPLVALAKELGWRVTVADPRPAYATAERFPGADRVLTGAAESLVAQADPEAGAAATVMTHHYVHDVPILRDLVRRPMAYVGLLGPKQRAERIVSDLAAGGARVPEPMRERLHAPTGLDIGAEGADEVALSILAEIRAALAGRAGGPLKDRKGPIHE
jgi:xanthine dehydrogenase accessory factor